MEARSERRSGVPAHKTVDRLITALRDKAANRPAELYPRDGNSRLHQQEERVAELVGVGQERLLLYPNGMTAVREAVDIATPRVGESIVYGNNLYSQCGWLFGEEMPSRGARTFSVNAGSLEEISSSIEKRRPVVVFFEPVANATAMPVLDLSGFLSLPIFDEEDYDPLIILDNTATTSTLLPPSETLARDDRRILIVESGTKFFGLNDEMVGIIYTNNDDLATQLRQRRPKTGTTPSDSAMERLDGLIPPSKDEFDKRVREVAVNTLGLAKAAHQAENNGSLFKVIHPNLPTHPNYEYAAEKFPDGASPFFFILPTGGSGQITQIDIARTLWADPDIKSRAKLGQSFGFNETRILINLDEDMSYIRVSGGTESEREAQKLQLAFYETLTKINREKVVIDENGDRVVVFGSDNNLRMPLLGQEGPDDCGQTYLKMLGYTIDELPKWPITDMDLAFNFGVTDEGYVALDNLDAASQEVPVWVLGKKIETGNDHWFLIVDNRVITSENGGEVVDRDTYLKEAIEEVKIAIKVPFANNKQGSGALV